MRAILIYMKDETAQKERMAATPSVLDTKSAGIDSVRRFSSTALLQGERQIVIEHAGREYRLRVTSQGKLILTA